MISVYIVLADSLYINASRSRHKDEETISPAENSTYNPTI